jgi:hypothetical protein
MEAGGLGRSTRSTHLSLSAQVLAAPIAIV